MIFHLLQVQIMKRCSMICTMEI
jgi:hypothetical protein